MAAARLRKRQVRRHRARPRRGRHARSGGARRAVRAPGLHADAARPPGRWPYRQSLRHAAWVVSGVARGRRSEPRAAPRWIVSWHAMPASTFWRSPSTIRRLHSRGCGAPVSRRRPLRTSTVRSTTWILPDRARGSRSSNCPTSRKAASTWCTISRRRCFGRNASCAMPNNAAALDEVVTRRGGSGGSGARFSRLIGCVVIPDPAGGFALELAHGRVRLLPPDADVPTVPSHRRTDRAHVRRERRDRPPAGASAAFRTMRGRRRPDRARLPRRAASRFCFVPAA